MPHPHFEAAGSPCSVIRNRVPRGDASLSISPALMRMPMSDRIFLCVVPKRFARPSTLLGAELGCVMVGVV